MATVMRASQAQRSRVGLEEGIRLKAYKDTVGVWTIGKGHAATNPIPVRGMLNGEYYEGKPKEGVTITASECERLFELDMDETERGISALVTADLTQNQFDALVDFVHQYGLDRLKESTLLVKINFNPNNVGTLDSKGIAYEFMRWDKAGGEIQEYVWRRSARRCCIYTGTLIPQKLWRECNTDGAYPFAIHDDGGWKVDYSKTPTIDQILADGRRLSKPPEPVVNKNWQDIVGTHPEPSITIITDKPAAPASSPVAKAGTPEPATQPKAPASPAQNSAASTSSGPSRDVAEPAGKAAPSQPVSIPGNAPVPPVFPKRNEPSIDTRPPAPPRPPPGSVAVNPSNADMGPGIKNMFRSKRFYGGLLIVVGRLIIVADVSGTFAEPVRALIGDGVIMDWSTGILVNIVGELVLDRGEKKATAPLGTPKEVALYTTPPVRS